MNLACIKITFFDESFAPTPSPRPHPQALSAFVSSDVSTQALVRPMPWGQRPVPELGGGFGWSRRQEQEWAGEGSFAVSYVYMTQCAKVTYCGCVIF